MKILVTGGAGYIGSHVVKQLGDYTKHEIVVLDNLVTGFRESILYGRFVEADLSDWDFVADFMKKEQFDAIIHFAASLIVPESVVNPLKYYLNNTANTANLIKCAVESGVKKFIFSSTAATYGEPDKKYIPINEECPTVPINPYGMSKLMSENILKDASYAHKGFKYVILRYFNVAGADVGGRIGQSTKDATHLIKVAAEAATGKRDKILVFGTDYDTPDGSCIRDYIHVDDLASAHLLALDYLDDNDSDIFNCGYSRGYSVLEVLNTMKKVTGVNFKVEITGRRAGDPAELVADNKKIVSKLKFNPKYNDLELICKTAYEWEKRLEAK
ncbi:UDP-glucose 4-epimerase GalE [Deferribacterales bacterium Es71-Z0220]|uniref:UDP-glucose 4-epimerase GalE n=1 Tax=Deferrivibrio essentukiensis TaxID=2880922 RepID=UPI001F614A3E|nr:UDP-glucose 4-epimerase GalE [Deferrivibrio essentukiensis]